METAITGIVYLDMLQLDKDDQEGHIHFQQDSGPSHYLGEVREYLSTRFSDWWIGRAAPITWRPRSRILHPWIFSYGDLYHLFSQMLSSELGLLLQLQK
jgi:hypothetical protein